MTYGPAIAPTRPTASIAPTAVLRTRVSYTSPSGCSTPLSRLEPDPLRPRAKTTSVRTMEHLRRLGLAERLRAASPIPVLYAQDVVFCTGLFGHEITRFTSAFALTTVRREAFAESSQQVPQPIVERVLRAHAAELPTVRLLIGGCVVTLEDGNTGVSAQVLTPSGEPITVTATYGSAPTASPEAPSVRDTRVVRGYRRTSASHSAPKRSRHVICARGIHYWVIGRTCGGLMGRLDLDGTWWAIVQGVVDANRVEPVTLVQELCGDQIDVEVCATDPWSARLLLSDRFAGRRTFLVGDAAHLNPPWGGHGFNTGVGDAVNLAWKMAAVLQGWGGHDLCVLRGRASAYRGAHPERRGTARGVYGAGVCRIGARKRLRRRPGAPRPGGASHSVGKTLRVSQPGLGARLRLPGLVDRRART